MKKGFVASVNSSGSGAKLSMVQISGDLQNGFRVGKPEVIDFQLVRGETMQGLSDYVNMRVLQSLANTPRTQKDIPFMLGIDPKLMSRLDCIVPRTMMNETKPLHDVLGNLWTSNIRRIHQNKIFIGVGNFVDEADYSPVPTEPISEEAIIRTRELVAHIDQQRNLDQLLEMAYTQGALNARKFFSFDRPPQSGNEVPRFTLYGDPSASAEQKIVFEYLNAHPLLKQAFAKGMMSERRPGEAPHFTCIKTRLDPRAHQYANIGITFLADECARDKGEEPIGHIQETV